MISGTQSGANNWANNSNSQNLTVNTPITSTLGPTNLILNGTGTGGVTFSGGIANGNGQLGAEFQSGRRDPARRDRTAIAAAPRSPPASCSWANSAALPAGQALTVNGGTLDLNGFSQSVAALNGGAAATIQSSGAAATLTAGAGRRQCGVLRHDSKRLRQRGAERERPRRAEPFTATILTRAARRSRPANWQSAAPARWAAAR